MRASVLQRLAARGGTSAHDWRFGHGRLSRKAVVIGRELICPFWLTKLERRGVYALVARLFKAAPAGIEGNLGIRRRQSDYSYEISARRTQ